MGTRAGLIEGLQIIERHETNAFVVAEHAIIYGGGDDIGLSAAECGRLEELGWFLDTEFDSWAFFT